MAGDVLKVMISDDSGATQTVFSPLAQGGTVFDQVRVAADGTISLPYVGSRQVKGTTLQQAENIIRRGAKGWAASPQVHVEMVGNVSGSVLVAGAVKTPGRFSSLQGPLTILDAINQAGGPSMEPFLIKVTLRTGKTVHVYNYQDLLSGRNREVPPNSEIILDRDRRRFIAMGAVAQPGLHDFPSATPSLLEVLGTVGGLNERMANPSGVFIFRLTDAA
ncbi:MAG TPA: polysaccharide biosynthesis/export family protein [Bordetella sp.]